MSTPAGWYDDGSGRQRWWDGQQWTEHFAPVAAPSEAPAPVADAAPSDALPPYMSTPDTHAYPGSQPTAGQASPGAYSTSGAYPTAGAYPATGAYPAAGAYSPSGAYGAPVAAAPKKLSVLGIVGLGLAVLGTILACIPVISLFGWILLPAGFIVSLISLFLKGTKWPGITGLAVSVLGTIIAAIMGLVFWGLLFASQVDTLPETFPSSPSDSGSTPADVAEGVLGEPVTVAQMSGSAEMTITSATWSATNDTSFEPSNGGYLVIDVSWETLDGTSYVNPLYFSVETADGTEGDLDIFGDATLEGGELTAGQSTQGTVSFDVAQSSSYVVIVTDELMQEVARVTVEASAG